MKLDLSDDEAKQLLIVLRGIAEDTLGGVDYDYLVSPELMSEVLQRLERAIADGKVN